jgi:ABC-type dipeptide/oligopeptide/nickel transport system permease component
MLALIVRRLLLAVPTMVAVMTVVFLLMRTLPGDVAYAILGDSASIQAADALRARLGLDRPLWEQYLEFLLGAFRGDLGTSLVFNAPVLGELWKVLPYTLDLTIAAILIGSLFGIPLGILSALRRNSWVDYLTRSFSLLGLSFPAFYTAILLILLFSIQLRWFPVISVGRLDDPLDRLYNLVLPAIAASLGLVAYITRATRSSMLEVLGEDYIRTARAKGVPRRLVVWRHALRNALIPVVTVIGLYLGLVIGNSVLVEIVFNRPGLGKLIVGSLDTRDYPMIQGLMIAYCFFIITTNLLTDLTYGLMDPRVKHQ